MACTYNPEIGVLDFLISAFLITGFLFFASQKAKNMVQKNPHYRYYVRGLIFKMAAVTAFLFIFVYYYNGGDTLAYHQGAIAMKNLFYENPAHYFELLLGPISYENYYNYFSAETCYPPSWMVKKESNFTVIRVASVVQLFLGDSIWATNLVIARLAYTPLFKLYGLFCSYFAGREKLLAYAFLFMPSVAFWGSGIMKDTIALSAICWLLVLFEQVAIQKLRISLARFFGIALAVYALFIVKTYLLLALMPGVVIWFNFERIVRIKSTFVRLVLFPSFFLISIGAVLFFYTKNSGLFGVYGADTVLEEAAKVQQDLVREEAYGSNSFDIGKFDPTLAGIASKIPPALEAGLFRPYLWEAGGSPTMLMAGFENLIILIMLIVSIIRKKLLGFVRYLASHPLFILSFTFILLLAFSIGLTSANFGALVRYKVPLVPFLMSILFMSLYSPKNES